MSNHLIQISKNLEPQTQHELQILNNKLQPHLKQYDQAAIAISEIIARWSKNASPEAKKFARPFFLSLGISKGYLSKLTQIESYKQEALKEEPKEFEEWFDSHGIDTRYELTKIHFLDMVVLWQEGKKVSYETVKSLKNKVIPLGESDTPKTKTEEDRECIRLGISKDRRDFLDLIIKNENLALINDHRLANYWSGLTDDEVLTLIEQKLIVGRQGKPEPSKLEIRLRELVFREIRIREDLKKESAERDQEKKSWIGV